MDIRTNLKKFKIFLNDLFFEKEDLNIYERILKVILFPTLVIPSFIIGLILLLIINVILPILYFIGGGLFDVVIYIITGEFKIYNFYKEKIQNY